MNNKKFIRLGCIIICILLNACANKSDDVKQPEIRLKPISGLLTINMSENDTIIFDSLNNQILLYQFASDSNYKLFLKNPEKFYDYNDKFDSKFNSNYIKENLKWFSNNNPFCVFQPGNCIYLCTKYNLDGDTLLVSSKELIVMEHTYKSYYQGVDNYSIIDNSEIDLEIIDSCSYKKLKDSTGKHNNIFFLNQISIVNNYYRYLMLKGEYIYGPYDGWKGPQISSPELYQVISDSNLRNACQGSFFKTIELSDSITKSFYANAS